MCADAPRLAANRSYTKTDTSSTPSRPTTEMIVSITDQLLIVWPTVIPKYSLTSQKPASLTCEKNSDPASTARASNATVGRSRPATSGATIPAAVMVATVAEPVASRIPTATSQPSTSGEKFAPLEREHGDDQPDQQRHRRVAEDVGGLLQAVVRVVDGEFHDRPDRHEDDRQEEREHRGAEARLPAGPVVPVVAVPRLTQVEPGAVVVLPSRTG